VLAGMLIWSFCTSAQDNARTNAPAATVTVERPASGLQVFPLPDKKVFLTFGLDEVEFLKRELPAGIPLWQYAASLIYILLAFVVSKLLDRVTRTYLQGWAARTKTKSDDLLLTLLQGPIKVISFVILLHVGLQVFDWPLWIEDFLKKGLNIIVACSLTYMGLKFIDLFIEFWKKRTDRDGDKSFDDQLFPIIDKALKVFLVIVAVLVTAQNLGLNISGAIASLSIGGLALGLAAQDTLANLFGAVSVFVDKPFRMGDRIQLDKVDGTVEAIGLRSTRVRSLDGHFITIPNKTMGGAIITNITRRTNIKTEMNLGLTYDTSIERLRRALQILEEVYKGHPMTFDVVIGFNRFADSALNIKVVHWWNSNDPKGHLAGMQEMNLAIKKRFDEEGISFAFPSQTVYLKQDSEWRIGDSANPADSANLSKETKGRVG